MGISKESIGICLGNRFHAKLRIFGLEICKQSLQVKRCKAKIRADKANKIKTDINKSEHKLRQAGKYVFPQYFERRN